VQSSSALSLTWESFNIAAQETVNFQQPSSSAIAINRIFDTNGTVILGRLNANGQVYLINPNGFLFGQSAQVNVAGLVASTLDLDDASLAGGNHRFSGESVDGVVNLGTISAAEGGYVALVGNHVSNQGVISARLGTVALGAGSTATLSFSGSDLVRMQVDESVLSAVAESGGLIQADGGMVLMTAGARDSLLASVVNNTGVIQARTVENRGGVITLLAGMETGVVQLGGALDASAPDGGDGGFIETSAAHVEIADDLQVTTTAASGRFGVWLIDPQDYTVGAGGDITGAQLSGLLANTSMILESGAGGAAGVGNLNVTDAVTWSANTSLMLTAANDVNINADITATGDFAGLTINPNTSNGLDLASGSGAFNLNHAAITLSGANPSLSIGGNSYVVINSLGLAGDASLAPGTPSLQGMTSSSMNGYYALGSNIDASDTLNWNSGAGFTPIGSLALPFTGTFDGLGHTITGLHINRPVADVGLFSSAGPTSLIQNVGLIGGHVTGASSAGGLVGSNYGAVHHTYNTGSVSGATSLGGLMGSNTGAFAIVTNSYATGNVTGTSSLGGLMGSNTGTVSIVFATGNVTGTSSIGGLMGSNTGAVSYAYATGNIDGTSSVGGLMGSNTGIVTQTYATGLVDGDSTVGPLAGSSTTALADSYWNSDSWGSAGLHAGNPLTTAQMHNSNSFPGWDFANIWISYDGVTNPLLRAFMTPLTVTANDAARVYDTLGFAGGNGVTYSAAPNGTLQGVLTYGGTSQGATNVGTYDITPGGLYSQDQLGYIITFVDGNLAITPASLQVTGITANDRVYDTTTTATLSGAASITALSDDEVVIGGSGIGVFSDEDVANDIAVSVSGYTLSGADAGNYVIVQPVGLSADITPASLAVTGISANDRTYDTTTNATLSGTANITALGSDQVAVGGSGVGVFADEDVANDIAVAVSGYTLSGVDAGNYVIVQPVNLVADITPAFLTVTGISANDRAYDTTTNTTLSGVAIVSALGSDQVSVGGSGAGVFADEDVANDIAVAVSGYTLSGVDAGNYVIVQPTGLAADITPASLTVTGISAIDRVYDTTTNATLSGTANIAALGNDQVTVGGIGSGVFADEDVASDIAVAVSGYTLSGIDAGNYIIVQPASVVADITPASLTVTGITANDRVYDTTTNATLSGAANVSALGRDQVTVGGSGAGVFADEDVANDIAVTVSGYTLSGVDAGNYVIVQPVNVVADITPASLTVTGITANDRVYDTTTNATLSGVAGVSALGNDQVTVGGSGAGVFADEDVANDIVVAVSGYSLSGVDAGNYVIVQPIGLAADITPASLTVTGISANDRVYDTTTNATLSGVASVSALGGDQVTVGGSGSGSFADEDVANDIAVAVSGYTLSGVDAGNYVIVQPVNLAADITPASLTVTGISANDRVYDTTTSVTLSGSANVTALGGDQVTVSGTGSGVFADEDVANDIAVAVSGYALSGADADNYVIMQPTGLAADITPAGLTVTGISANDRVYDTTTHATLSGVANVTAFGSDQVTVGGSGSGSFADEDVANDIAVSVSGYTLSGVDAGNYVIVQPINLAADITPASLNVTGVSANDRVYDTTTAATLNGLASVAALGNDQVTVTGTGTGVFAEEDAASDIAVAVSGYTLSGADAGNYIILQPTGLTADITPATLTVTGIFANDRVYDGTAAATLGGTANVAALGSDQVSVSGTGVGVFADPNIGNDIAVAVSGYSLGGIDAGNYIIAQPANVVADILPGEVTPPIEPVADSTLGLDLCVPQRADDLDRLACPIGAVTTTFDVTTLRTPGPTLTFVGSGVNLPGEEVE